MTLLTFKYLKSQALSGKERLREELEVIARSLSLEDLIGNLMDLPHNAWSKESIRYVTHHLKPFEISLYLPGTALNIDWPEIGFKKTFTGPQVGGLYGIINRKVR